MHTSASTTHAMFTVQLTLLVCIWYFYYIFEQYINVVVCVLFSSHLYPFYIYIDIIYGMTKQMQSIVEAFVLFRWYDDILGFADTNTLSHLLCTHTHNLIHILYSHVNQTHHINALLSHTHTQTKKTRRNETITRTCITLRYRFVCFFLIRENRGEEGESYIILIILYSILYMCACAASDATKKKMGRDQTNYAIVNKQHQNKTASD